MQTAGWWYYFPNSFSTALRTDHSDKVTEVHLITCEYGDRLGLKRVDGGLSKTLRNVRLAKYFRGDDVLTPLSDLQIGDNVERLELVNFDFEMCRSVWAQTPKLQNLTLEGVEFSENEFAHMPARLQSLSIVECKLERFPRYFGLMFPTLKKLSIRSCRRIRSLKDVELPSKLETLDFALSHGMSLTGLVLPDTLKEFFIVLCGRVEGLSSVKLPQGLKKLDISGSEFGWISMKFRFPPNLEQIELPWLLATDIRNMSRNTNIVIKSMLVEHLRCSHYNHQDAITLFVHNNVLPNELLRHIFTYLE